MAMQRCMLSHPLMNLQRPQPKQTPLNQEAAATMTKAFAVDASQCSGHSLSSHQSSDESLFSTAAMRLLPAVKPESPPSLALPFAFAFALLLGLIPNVDIGQPIPTLPEMGHFESSPSAASAAAGASASSGVALEPLEAVAGTFAASVTSWFNFPATGYLALSLRLHC